MSTLANTVIQLSADERAWAEFITRFESAPQQTVLVGATPASATDHKELSEAALREILGKLEAHLKLPRYDAVLVDHATPLPAYTDDELKRFDEHLTQLELSIAAPVKKFVTATSSPMVEAMSLFERRLNDVYNGLSDLSRYYANERSPFKKPEPYKDRDPNTAKAKGFTNDVINLLHSVRSLEGWARIPTYAEEFYGSASSDQASNPKPEALKDNEEIKRKLESIRAKKQTLTALQNQAYEQVKILLFRVEWVRRLSASAGQDFNASNCLKILAADRIWQKTVVKLLGNIESEVVDMLRNHPELFKSFQAKTGRTGVSWSHTPQFRDEIATCQQSSNPNQKSDDEYRQLTLYVYSPQLVKPDRHYCFACNKEFDSLYPWQDYLPKSHDNAVNHPHFQRKIGERFKPMYLALVWSEASPSPSYGRIGYLLAQSKYVPNEIIDPRNRTALHWLADVGHKIGNEEDRTKIFTKLLAGADKNIRDGEGDTAYDILQRNIYYYPEAEKGKLLALLKPTATLANSAAGIAAGAAAAPPAPAESRARLRQ